MGIVPALIKPWLANGMNVGWLLAVGVIVRV